MQTIHKQLQNNREKCQRTTFLSSKILKMTLSESQNLNLNFHDHLQTFRVENTTKNSPFKAKNNAYKTFKQQQSTSIKSIKGFLHQKMVKLTPFENLNLKEILNFRGYLSRIPAKNTHKSELYQGQK